MRHSRNLSIVAFVMSLLTFLASPARAVVIEPGRIETSGTTATIDLIYFSTEGPGGAEIGLSPRCFGTLCDVITTERSGIALYNADASGGVGTYIAGDPGDAATAFSSISETLAFGNYVLAVSWYELLSGELGPIQIDTGINLAFDYEIGFSGSAGSNVTITCKASGNLDGTFTLDVRTAGANCKLPTAAVPEPAPMSLMLIGALALLRRRFSQRSAVALRPAQNR
jgi:hypothetical protein